MIDLEGLLPAAWHSQLCPEVLLRSPEECRARQSELGLAAPYFDEVLREDGRLYVEYIASLHAAGMLVWNVEVLNETAPFFVWKDNTSLRCLFDCRLCNEAFHQPLGCHLGSAESLASMEVPCDRILYGTGYDIKDYYHAMRLPSGSRHTSAFRL